MARFIQGLPWCCKMVSLTILKVSMAIVKYIQRYLLFLNADETYFETDIPVICDKDKLVDEGCKGTPDWIIEIDFSGISIE